jgi:putative ABC transport system permease protein
LLLLQGTVAAVLLIACANVAGLLLAQAGSQQRELAVQAALGSGTWRIVRQLLVHSLILSNVGGALGFGVGWASVRLMTKVVLPFAGESYGEAGGGGLPRILYEVGVDESVLAFTFAVSIVCGLVAGIAPAFQVSHAQPVDVLRESNRSASASASRQRLRSIFVTAQIALALMLLVTSGLMLRGLMQMMSENIGFETTDLVTAQLQLPDHNFRRPTGRTLESGSLRMSIDPEMRINVERMRANLADITGVTAASGIAIYPPMSGALNLPVRVDDATAQQRPQFLPVLPDYFKSLQVRVVEGREFRPTDTPEAAAVAIVNASMARRFWPGKSALGKTVRLDTPMVPNDPARQIVGVVDDINQYPGQKDRPQLYVPFSQMPLIHDERLTNHLRDVTFVIRTRRPVHELNKSIEAAIAEVDSSQAISRIRTMEQTAFGAAQRRRVYATIIGTFGAIAVLLAVIGVYGVMAHMVTQRTNELGIRIALGAAPPQLRRLVIRHAGVLIGCGLAAGVLGSLALARAIRGALYGMSPTDPLTFVLSAVLVGLIALAASYIPAWRASRISPMIALRHN